MRFRAVFVSVAGMWLGCSGNTPPVASGPQPVATALVTNASRNTECAEEDNVYVKLSGVGLSGMRIEARQPSYIGQLSVDESKADFSNCHFEKADNPVYHFEPKKVVLWENERFYMLGNTYESFWRPDEVDVVINGQVTRQIHLIQLHLKDASEQSAGRHEFLVLYPPDGYWRVKPIPASPLPSSTYGTSILVGPMVDAKRPYVELAKVEFIPDQLSFVIDYEDGSRGTMKLSDVTREKVALDYHHDRAVPETQPLAAIRSMYVTPEKSDVAEVTWRVGAHGELSKLALPAFTHTNAAEVAFGRSVISNHNPSAPDLWFGQFALSSLDAPR